MRVTSLSVLLFAIALPALASEVTLRNDSLSDFGNAAIVWGFAPGEKAASWLTSPCSGNLVAVQVFWRSPSGTSATVIGSAIEIFRGGSFPQVGALADVIVGPVLTDNALNEWRFLDENNTLPLSVPVEANETVVVAFGFAEAPQAGTDPSVVRDTDGITPNRNAIYADIGGSFAWMSAGLLGVSGDWLIRAVVDCQAMPTAADVSVTMSADAGAYTAGAPLRYTIVVANAGPAAAANVTLVDTFPAAFQTPTWTCSPTGGATCPSGGSGNIIGTASLPAGAQIGFNVDGTVASGTTGVLSNSMTAVVGAPASDPDTGNNTATLSLNAAAGSAIFANGFEALVTVDLTPLPAGVRVRGSR